MTMKKMVMMKKMTIMMKKMLMLLKKKTAHTRRTATATGGARFRDKHLATLEETTGIWSAERQ